MIGTQARAALVVAAVLFSAAPAETMPEPVDVTNAVFDTTGHERLRIRRLGKDEDFPSATITFDGANGFQAVANTGVTVSGTYEARGRRRNKLRFTADSASLIAIQNDVIDVWGEQLLADRGRAPDGTVELRNYRLRGKVSKAGDSIKVKGVFRFRATETATGRTVGGSYTVRLQGPRQ